MMISTKGRYALRVMIDIAENQHDGYLPLREIAARQEISEKYLEAIVKSLVKAQYLTGLRGKAGGYRLTRPPQEYTVGSILRLTEGSLAPVACLGDNPPDCPRMADCRTLPMWRELNTMIQNYFDGITLADLAKGVQPGNDYVI
ncbi:RrF2 family transcriptional regulator [uncultured Gemmiger sp.]|uniref:RrF2 family transcriptional regulator n=1 Tax=uncultured Gemmiger sp. TaxID=1623490 RepID=UPI0025CBB1C9|nr:RrF2 family transcriptional regulator [uncultured Gemmiger sp.]